MTDKLSDELVNELVKWPEDHDDSHVLALALEVQEWRRLNAEFDLPDGRTMADELRITREYYRQADYPGHLVRAGHRIIELQRLLAERDS